MPVAVMVVDVLHDVAVVTVLVLLPQEELAKPEHDEGENDEEDDDSVDEDDENMSDDDEKDG